MIVLKQGLNSTAVPTRVQVLTLDVVLPRIVAALLPTAAATRARGAVLMTREGMRAPIDDVHALLMASIIILLLLFLVSSFSASLFFPSSRATCTVGTWYVLYYSLSTRVDSITSTMVPYQRS